MSKSFPIIAMLRLIITGIGAMPSTVTAQNSEVRDTGTMAGNVNFTDIRGNKTSLYDYLGHGYMVVIELGLTTCPICWQYRTTGLMEVLYKKYGPNGTVFPKKIMPIFIECDPNRSRDDLNGTGPRTRGDWVSGVSHTIVDLTKGNLNATVGAFIKTTSFSTPTFVVICPDGKLVYSTQGANNYFDESLLVKLMKGCCLDGSTMTMGMDDMFAAAPVKLYPNPANDILYIKGAAS